MLLWFYVQELPKAQPAVVLVLKRLRRLKVSSDGLGEAGNRTCSPWIYEIWKKSGDKRLYLKLECPQIAYKLQKKRALGHIFVDRALKELGRT